MSHEHRASGFTFHFSSGFTFKIFQLCLDHGRTWHSGSQSSWQIGLGFSTLSSCSRRWSKESVSWGIGSFQAEVLDLNPRLLRLGMSLSELSREIPHSLFL